MNAFLAKAPAAPRDFAACSGCSLCLLVCPSWRGSRDRRLAPEGMAKALQCGATVSQLLEPIEACSLCGACEPVCPERIDLIGLVMELRHKLPPHLLPPALQPSAALATEPVVTSSSAPLLLPGVELSADVALLNRVQAQLGILTTADDGSDIAMALETGADIPLQRLQQFLEPLRGHTLVVADGLLLRQLRRWIPGSKRVGLGAALSSMASLRSKLKASDLYVIEPRAYHADYERMVKYYSQLQNETGCLFNLDLQRIVIPARLRSLPQVRGRSVGDDATQAKWILQGRKPARIVVESVADRGAFEGVCDVPVVHLVDLAEGGT